MRLQIIPVDLCDANAFVAQHHRHHQPVCGHKFSIGVAGVVSDTEYKIHGVCIVGRPVSRMLDTGWTLELTRCCTDGTANAASMLYGAARRAAFAMGYRRLITYILAVEPGTSLKAAGWKLIGDRGGGSWSRKDRPRVDKHPLQGKLLWEAA